MAGIFVIEARMKHFFFDRKAVKDAMHDIERKGLSKAGAHIRTTAKRIQRRRKSVSMPGTPPSAHSKDKVATLKNIWFVYEPQNHGVVIGPLKLERSRMMGPQLGSNTVPALHEFGANVPFRETRLGTRWVTGARPRPGKRTRVRVAHYPARPYMGPALEKNLDAIPKAFVGHVSN
jgi:hypothetical protein